MFETTNQPGLIMHPNMGKHPVIQPFKQSCYTGYQHATPYQHIEKHVLLPSMAHQIPYVILPEPIVDMSQAKLVNNCHQFNQYNSMLDKNSLHMNHTNMGKI